MRKRISQKIIGVQRLLRLRWMEDTECEGADETYKGQIYGVSDHLGEEIGCFLYWEESQDFQVYIGDELISDDGHGSILDAALAVWRAAAAS